MGKKQMKWFQIAIDLCIIVADLAIIITMLRRCKK